MILSTQQNESENQQNESATDSEMPEPELPDNSDSASSDGESSDDSYIQTTWREDIKYSNDSNYTSNHGKSDGSNIILKFAQDSESSEDFEDDDSEEYENERPGSESNINRFKKYIAEKIMKHKHSYSGKMFYSVRWIDFPPELADTWQSEKSFPPGFAMLQEYKAKHKLT